MVNFKLKNSEHLANYREENKAKFKAYRSEYYKNNRDNILKIARERDRKNRAAITERKRKRRMANPGLHKERAAKYYVDNLLKIKVRVEKFRKVHSERFKKLAKERHRKNPLETLARKRKRHLAKKQATPPWITSRDRSEIFAFKRIAKELRWLSNEPLHVDHIVPIQGKIVCGLNVPWNLQILTATENKNKSNKLLY